MHVPVHAMFEEGCPWKPEEGTYPPEMELVTGGYELPDMGAEMQTQALWKSNKYS